MEEKGGACRFLVEKPERKRPLERPDVDGKIILKGSYRNRTEELVEAVVNTVMSNRVP
jgi:hypothetical protein